MNDQERVESLGGFDPPLFPIWYHPFNLVEGNRYCGTCGGGIMHQVHKANMTSGRRTLKVITRRANPHICTMYSGRSICIVCGRSMNA